MFMSFTFRHKKVHGLTFYCAGWYADANVYESKYKSNPIPRWCDGEPYNFSCDISRHWTSCAQYPLFFAFANYLWWNSTSDSTVVHVCPPSGGSATFGLVAKFMHRKVVVVANSNTEPYCKELTTMSCLNAAEFKPWWTDYDNATRLMLFETCARNVRSVDEVDAFTFLHTQTQSVTRRYTRSAVLTHAGCSDHLAAVKVRVPQTASRQMLGLKAAKAIPAKTKICTGRGFWWPEGFPLPAKGRFGKDPYTTPRPLYGVRLQQSQITKGLVYVMNASSGMSLFNHYNGFMNKPNAELVVEAYQEDGKEKHTVSIAVVTKHDIGLNTQVCVDYGPNFLYYEGAGDIEDTLEEEYSQLQALGFEGAVSKYAEELVADADVAADVAVDVPADEEPAKQDRKRKRQSKRVLTDDEEDEAGEGDEGEGDDSEYGVENEDEGTEGDETDEGDGTDEDADLEPNLDGPKICVHVGYQEEDDSNKKGKKRKTQAYDIAYSHTLTLCRACTDEVRCAPEEHQRISSTSG